MAKDKNPFGSIEIEIHSGGGSKQRRRVGREFLEDLPDAPLRHEDLQEDMQKVARHTFHIAGKYLQPTLEQWELGFMRDTNPRSEMGIWIGICHAIEAWAKDNPKKATEKGRRHFMQHVVHVSMGGEVAAGASRKDRRLHDEALRRFNYARKHITEIIRAVLSATGD